MSKLEIADRIKILIIWVAALKSGKYLQTKNYLGRKVNGKDCFCSLGLLCEVMNVPRTYTVEGYYAFEDTVLNSSITALPTQIKEALSLIGSAQFYPAQAWAGNLYYDIAGLNDAGMPFPDIAAVVQDRFIDNRSGWQTH